MSELEKKIEHLLNKYVLDDVDNWPVQEIIYLVGQPQWIKVSDRLPPRGKVVTTWGGCSLPMPAYMNDGKWWDECDEEWTTGITHWKLLDKPPVE